EMSYPVTIAVRRPDGSVEHVRVGTATRRGDGFSLQLGEMSIGAGEVTAEPPPASSRRAASSQTGGMVFPNYGRSKGAPTAGAPLQDLEYYAAGARRTLGDPSKSRFHEKERQLLAAIEAELARQGHAPARSDDDEPPPRGDEDMPF